MFFFNTLIELIEHSWRTQFFGVGTSSNKAFCFEHSLKPAWSEKRKLKAFEMVSNFLCSSFHLIIVFLKRIWSSFPLLLAGKCGCGEHILITVLCKLYEPVNPRKNVNEDDNVSSSHKHLLCVSGVRLKLVDCQCWMRRFLFQPIVKTGLQKTSSALDQQARRGHLASLKFLPLRCF